MRGAGFLARLGIVRHTMRRDLLCFLLPWFALFVLDVYFCRNHGDGLSSLWRDVGVVVMRPWTLAALPAHRSAGLALLGALMVFAGLPVYAASLYGLLAMLGMIPLVLYRIGLEEYMLAEHFGQAYESYRARTKRLVPLLY